MLSEGNSAPDFRLGGRSLSAELARGPVLLVFFKISCPTCRLSFPFLQRLADAAGPGTPRVIAVSQDDAKNTAQFQAHFGTSLDTLIDPPPYAVSSVYGIRNVPTLFLIEPDQTVSLAFSGFSKAHFETLAERFATPVFRSGEQVPALRPG
jgi:peroxiredoxin